VDRHHDPSRLLAPPLIRGWADATRRYSPRNTWLPRRDIVAADLYPSRNEVAAGRKAGQRPSISVALRHGAMGCDSWQAKIIG